MAAGRIKLRQKGNWNKTKGFLHDLAERRYLKILDKYGAKGVNALRDATPKRTGLTADSWSYKISETKKGWTVLAWTNSNINQGKPVAFMIQYGHGMPNGGYVEGIDYINPALKPIFDQIADEIMVEIHKSYRP